ncbi:MAG: hypothetical protein WC748_09490 [Legionellales bacterium]
MYKELEKPERTVFIFRKINHYQSDEVGHMLDQLFHVARKEKKLDIDVDVTHDRKCSERSRLYKIKRMRQSNNTCYES